MDRRRKDHPTFTKESVNHKKVTRTGEGKILLVLRAKFGGGTV